MRFASIDEDTRLMLTFLWVLLGATCVGMVVAAWQLVRERISGPRPVTIRSADEAPTAAAAAPGVSRFRAVEIPVDTDYARRSGTANFLSVALICGVLVAIPLIGVRAFTSGGHPVPTWLVLTTAIAGMLAAIVAISALRALHAYRRIADRAGSLGLRLSQEGICCSVVTLGGRQRSALVREERTSRLIPWSDVAGIETQEYRSGGGAAWFLVLRVRSSDQPWMIRFSALSAPHARIVEVVREASAALVAA